MLLWLLAIAAAVGVVLWLWNLPRKLPPGPSGLPFVGLLNIDFKDTPRFFMRLAEKYGSVFSYTSWGTSVVVLNDYESIKRVFVTEGGKVEDRPITFITARNQRGNYGRRLPGLVAANGNLWRTQRRFALSTMRDFGVGKPLMENGILTEMDALAQVLSDTNSKPFDPRNHLNNAVSNVLCQLVFGKRFEYSDKEFWDILNKSNDALAGGNAAKGIGITERMAYLIPGALKFADDLIAIFRKLQAFSASQIKEHKATFHPHDEATDYIYAYLQKQRHGVQTFSDRQLLFAVNQLFQAGTETTSTTLRWAILYCTVHPEVQEKVFQEIKNNLGTHSWPQMKDKGKLVYTEAVLLETQRLATLVPLIIREAKEEISLGEYSIPKGAAVMGNFESIHYDPHLFPEPFDFKPDRFLNSAGNKVIRPDFLLPFGAGKRICLGESLAKMELFLFFAGLIQRFEFQPPEGAAPLDWRQKLIGITTQPAPFEIVAIPRS